jgi:hypothetical protein
MRLQEEDKTGTGETHSIGGISGFLILSDKFVLQVYH